jgi:hypothetical protein
MRRITPPLLALLSLLLALVLPVAAQGDPVRLDQVHAYVWCSGWAPGCALHPDLHELESGGRGRITHLGFRVGLPWFRPAARARTGL